VKARLLLTAVGLAWGLTWPATRVALTDFPPFTMRALAAFFGIISIFALARAAGRPMQRLPRSSWPYVVIVSLLNIIVFSVCAAYAQLNATTGRVAILVYTMPIWASLLAWYFLGERMNTLKVAALLLCCAGLAILIYPLMAGGIPIGVLLSLCSAVSWAIGTIYIKRSRIDIEPFTLAGWQLVVSLAAMAALALIFENSFRLSAVHLPAWLGVLFAGVFGSAIAYYLWFLIIRLLPASTASLGALSSPVIGVISSALLLGEWPTATDVIGFALIFAASASILLQPQFPPVIARRPT
jgi:drug/metabolite transporter (DMT)-like permease